MMGWRFIGTDGNVYDDTDRKVYADRTEKLLRSYTSAENADADARQAVVNDTEATTANATSLRDKARTAMTINDAFLALPTPTNAQTLPQVQRLTRENTALIRLVIGALDSTSGT